MILYHVTPMDNVPSIRANGLVPSIGPRATEYGEACPAIYLFTSVEAMEDGLSNWLGECFGEEDLAILEVDIPEELTDTLKHDPAVGYEAVATQPISAKHIMFFTEDMKPLV